MRKIVIKKSPHTSCKIVAFVFLFCISALSLGFFLLIHPYRSLVPTLMYHAILDTKEQVRRSDMPAITLDLFKQQMDYIERHGYEPVSLLTVIEMRKEGKPIPSHWVVLTFDHALKTFYDNAWPVLKAHRFKATLFVSPRFVGSDENHLNWAQLEETHQSGLVEVGSHSLYHALLPCLPKEEAKKRMRQSKFEIEEHLKTPVKLFAYPFGSLNLEVKKLVQETGYEGAVGTVYPRGNFPIRDIFNLRRMNVYEFSKNPFVFRYMLSGYYVPTVGLFLKMANIQTPRAAERCGDYFLS